MNKQVWIVIGVIILILGIGYIATNSNNQAVTESIVGEDKNISATTKQATTYAVSASTSEPASTDVESASSTSPRGSGSYQEYSAEKIAASDAEHILLFFHATWCPSCRALDTDITTNSDEIPAGVEIYKVDYDTKTALKQQYGVTTQHSIIEINADGEAQSSISHPLRLSGVLSTI